MLDGLKKHIMYDSGDVGRWGRGPGVGGSVVSGGGWQQAWPVFS